MFNMAESASRIKNARIAKNLTQTNIADALGVSYQAVSNWERGNSMPDIGKLGELSDLLEVSIEDLLGHTRASKTIEKVMQKENMEISLPELSEISPVLPPDITGQLAGHLRAKNIEELSMIAPFVSKEALEQLGEGLMARSIEDLCVIAPFVGQEILDHMIGEELRAESIEELSMIAPFVSKEALEQLGRLPERILIPVGNGTLFLGALQALEHLLESGCIPQMPEIIAVQGENCDPLLQAALRGEDVPADVTPRPTLAEGIAIGKPMRGREILAYARKYGIRFVHAPEEEILPARAALAKKGIYCEHTTAANYAAYLQYCKEYGPARDCLITMCGAGLKSDH